MDLILAAKFGDACLYKQQGSREYQAFYSGTEHDWIMYKAKTLGYTERLRTKAQHKDAWGKKAIHEFRTAPDAYISAIARSSVEDCIKLLTVDELIVWYLDDGSWHRKKHFMHLYCNMLDDEQTQLLCDQFYKLLSIKPTIRKDRKTDGRSYNYIYLGTALTNVFGSFVESFVTSNNIYGMYYKIGLSVERPTAIPQGSSGQETAKWVAA